MAIKTTTTFIDDFDNSELDPNVKSTTFALNGTTYEIDLNDKNAAALADALEPFIAKARPIRASRGSSRGGSKRAGSNAARLGKIRDWAASNGHNVSSRGRIPAVVVEAYETATGDRS
jgi:hypothetical protein